MRTYTPEEKGSYFFVPLKYDSRIDLKELKLKCMDDGEMNSSDLSDLILKKCRKDTGFVRRYILKDECKKPLEGINDLISSKSTPSEKFEVKFERAELIVFKDGIAFLALWCTYGDMREIYHLSYPGYVGKYKDDLDLRKNITNVIRTQLISLINESAVRFDLNVEDDSLAIKESYMFNAVTVTERFPTIEDLKKVTFNIHKLININKVFEDPSENDIEYAFGAKDVKKKTYRWGSCITSQSISFVYANDEVDENGEKKKIQDICDCDFQLTLLCLYQKYMCMKLNDSLHQSNAKEDFRKISKEASDFRIYGTINPSQISRWNNVCDISRKFQIVNDVNESLQEIELKTELYNSAVERRTNEIEGTVATIIAVFGIVSILASVLTIVDFISTGNPLMVYTLLISSAVVLLTALVWYCRFRKKKGE